jgi:hypothetical protein
MVSEFIGLFLTTDKGQRTTNIERFRSIRVKAKIMHDHRQKAGFFQIENRRPLPGGQPSGMSIQETCLQRFWMGGTRMVAPELERAPCIAPPFCPQLTVNRAGM